MALSIKWKLVPKEEASTTVQVMVWDFMPPCECAGGSPREEIPP